jgi:plastocyanin
MKKPALPLFAFAFALLATACGGGGGPQAASPATSTAPPSATLSTTPSLSPTPACLPGGTTLNLTAKDVSFSTDCLAVKSGTAFAIVFTNKDGVAHNVDITLEDGTSVFKGDLVTSKTVTYRVPTLAAGIYPFLCDIHPSIMQGTLVVR